MKIYKDNTLSLIPWPFGLRGRLFLGVGVAMFFNLDEPDALLDEQDLWETVPTLLGDQVLDQGMPKQQGEMLLCGSCHAPAGKPVRAVEISARIGALKKSLYVVGDRYWDGKKIIGPEPYTRMPIDWAHAYGGPDFARNPQGKGYMASGGKGRRGKKRNDGPCPLPNIENPADLIRRRDQQPEPAGFGPLGPTWRQRSEQAGSGTYDDRWLLERWPYLPDDFDLDYFNCAQPDQWRPRDENGQPFFKPGDPIEISHMHPRKPVIASHLPTGRLRLFAITDPDFDPFRFPTSLPSHTLKDSDVMREVATRLETVWLFPEVERGVAIHRGAFEIRDDEFADVTRLFATVEAADDPPRDLDHYRWSQETFLQRMAGVDMAESGDALAGARKALRGVGNLPKKIRAMRDAAFGRVPIRPAPGLADMEAQNASVIAESRAMLKRMEAQMIPELSELGAAGQARKMIRTMRGRLDQNEAELTKNLASLAQEHADNAAVLEEELGQMEAADSLDPQQAEEIKSHIAMLRDGRGMKPPSIAPWHDMGFALVCQACRVVEYSPAHRQTLEAMGFERETLADKWLGLLESEHRSHPDQWGLDDGEGDCVLPAGLVLPRFDGHKLVALHGVALGEIGRGDAVKTAPGSLAQALFYPASSLIGVPGMPAREKAAPVLVVADPFSAVLAEQEIGDFCSVIALETPEPTDDAGGDALAKAPLIYLLQGAGGAEADLAAWRAVIPNIAALRFERAQTLFEAHRAGESLRDLLLKTLPPESFPEHALDTTLPPPGKPPDENFLKGFELPDIGAINTKLREELLDHHVTEMEALLNSHPQWQAMAGQSKKLDLRAMLAQHEKLDIDETMALAQSLAQEGLAMLDGLKPQDTETFKSRINENIERLVAEKETIKTAMDGDMVDAVPEDMKQQFVQSGIDIAAMKKRSREEVVQMHARGQTLSGAILDDVDLSGLKLSGADFSRCRLQRTNFSDAILDGCRFDTTQCSETIFANTSLKKAKLENSILDKPVMTGADLTGAEMEKLVVSNADCKNAVFNDAVWTLGHCTKCNMEAAQFKRFKSHLAMFSDIILDKADFSGAEMTKTVFESSSANQARFISASLHDTMFDGVEGEEVDFSRADLDKWRSMGNTILRQARFTNASMKRASLFNSDFGGSVFTGAVLDHSIVQSCQLAGADLVGVRAREARLAKTNLDGADMRGMNLYGACLKNAKVTRADLSHSHLYNAQLYKLVTGDTKLDGADYRNTLLHKAEQARKTARSDGGAG
ncbi:MAG: DUF2169 domain-containing protein [Hyphomicrobiales bacterium]